MGIPYFYRQLINKYPNIILKNNKWLDKPYLYFDYNCLIHPVSHNVINENKNNNLTLDVLENLICEEIIKYTSNIINMIKPKFIFIAVDGVAPRAKQIQQRKRRYKAAKEKIDNNSIFDSNSISPGTPFMIKLDNYINKFIKNELMDKKIIYSSYNEVGEGEHCILQYINNMKNSNNYQHIIYGLDADLIMLALSTHLNDIYLLREIQHFESKSNIENNNELHFLSIKNLKYAFKKDIELKYNFRILNINNIIDDFIFLCFFLGNDFLPHIKAIDIYNNGINVLLKEYIYFLKKNNQYEYLIINKKNINMTFLKNIIKNLAYNENALIKYNISKNNNINNFDPIRYLDKNWNYRYYSYFYKTNDKIFIENACKNYWNMIKWTFEYYFNKCPSWDYYFYYNSPPTLFDLYKFIELYDLNNVSFPSSKPCSIYQQLMMILPPNSSNLLPTKYANLMKNELIQYYPIDFILETVDKKVNWMFEPILPYIDEKHIFKYVK